MSNTKHFRAFAFLGKRGGVIIKKRFKLLDGERISLNGGEPIPLVSFGKRWTVFEKFCKEITKEQAKKIICESLFI